MNKKVLNKDEEPAPYTAYLELHGRGCIFNIQLGRRRAKGWDGSIIGECPLLPNVIHQIEKFERRVTDVLVNCPMSIDTIFVYFIGCLC